MKTVTMPFAPWEPDKPALGGEQNPMAFGVIPSAKGYRPFRSAMPSGGPLPSRVLGAFAFADPPGSPLTVAGTQSAIYARGGTEASSWEKKTTGSYAALNNGWNFAMYGQGIFAANGVDGLLRADVGAGAVSNFSLVPDSPSGRCLAPVGNFLMVGDIPGHRNRVRWSGMDNPLSWPEPGSNDAQYVQSDFNDFPEGGNVQAIASGMSAYDALVICESAIYRAQYVGPPYIFSFTDVDKGRGTIAPRSVIHVGDFVYFLAEDGLYATDGGSCRNIGIERLNLWWRATADDKRRSATLAAYDPINGVIAFAFPSMNCPEDMLDTMVLFHPELNRFSLVAHTMEWLHTDAARGMSLESLDGYGALDKLPFSLDSKGLVNGVPGLACFGTDHGAHLFSGAPVPAVMETAEKGGGRMMIHGARPAIDGAEASVSILVRDFQRNMPLARPCAAPSARDGVSRCHIAARYARVRVDIPGGAAWTHAIGVDLFCEEEGGL